MGDRDNFVRRFFAAVDKQDFDFVRSAVDPECKITAPDFEGSGPDAVAGWMSAFFAGLPDLTHRPTGIVGSDDAIAFEIDIAGTHTAELPQLDGSMLAPTGRAISLRLGEFWSLRDSKISRYAVYYDRIELARQLGAV
jgi:ketosteroid isomerase-like protein